MKLNDAHREVISEMLERLKACPAMDCYLCMILYDVVTERSRKEQNVWYGFLVPWRRSRISAYWLDLYDEMRIAITKGIGLKSTLGMWYEEQARTLGINSHKSITHSNDGLYREIRIAWMERALYMGELK